MTRARLALVSSLVGILTVGLVAFGSTVPATASGHGVAASSSIHATTAAKARTWYPKQGAFFNKPRTAKDKFILEHQVVRAIKHADPHSYIRIAVFSFDRNPVADALIDAYKKRHVHVQLIINDHEWTGAQHHLRRVLGSNTSKSSFLYHCKGGSCRGDGDVQHSKFYLFTHTGAATHTVMLGSYNQKMNAAANQYNDLWVHNKARELHDYLKSIFNQMRQDKPLKSPYRQKSFHGGHWLLDVLPYGGKWNHDPIHKALNPVHCFGAHTKSGRTIVRVNMHAWEDQRGVNIAKQLRSLYAQGCDVKVQYGMAGKRVREVFAQKTKRGFVPVRSNGFDTDGDGIIDLYTHQKLLEVNGHYSNTPDRKLVWTGSSNYQKSGQYGDEIIFRIMNPQNYGTYAKNWKWMWTHKTRSTPWMSAGRVSTDGRTLDVPTLLDPLSDSSLKALHNAG